MAANVAVNVVKEKCVMCFNDEENSEKGSCWIGCEDPHGRRYHQSCVGMDEDEEDIGNLGEEKWVYSQCSGSSVG